jgi:hypothetical protein
VELIASVERMLRHDVAVRHSSITGRKGFFSHPLAIDTLRNGLTHHPIGEERYAS